MCGAPDGGSPGSINSGFMPASLTLLTGRKAPNFCAALIWRKARGFHVTFRDQKQKAPAANPATGAF
jgi:hypothetical protein